jgi:hypothetical protein
VGAGQTGVPLPPGIPDEIRPTIMAVAARTFHEAFTSAMRVTLVLPLAVLGLAAIGVLLVRRERPAVAAATPPGRAEAAQPETVPG